MAPGLDQHRNAKVRGSTMPSAVRFFLCWNAFIEASIAASKIPVSKIPKRRCTHYAFTAGSRNHCVEAIHVYVAESRHALGITLILVNPPVPRSPERWHRGRLVSAARRKSIRISDRLSTDAEGIGSEPRRRFAQIRRRQIFQVVAPHARACINQRRDSIVSFQRMPRRAHSIQ